MRIVFAINTTAATPRRTTSPIPIELSTRVTDRSRSMASAWAVILRTAGSPTRRNWTALIELDIGQLDANRGRQHRRIDLVDQCRLVDEDLLELQERLAFVEIVGGLDFVVRLNLAEQIEMSALTSVVPSAR